MTPIELQPNSKSGLELAMGHDRLLVLLARQALLLTGYYTPAQVGDDVAPRIAELYTGMKARNDALLAENQQLRKACRRVGNELVETERKRAKWKARAKKRA